MTGFYIKMMNDVELTYMITSIVLGVLFIVSELFGLSVCKPNSITEWVVNKLKKPEVVVESQ